MAEALTETTAIQRRVADPVYSAWVSANAGTGKTFVLVRRVVRCLLSGASPQSILCITFTKAAAAEMSSRLLSLLSTWSLMPDDRLIEALTDVTGEVPDPASLPSARRLFARALESPGGLKIQTIHSFCSSILARFPAEAGLPLGFTPLEDEQSAAMLKEAVLMAAQRADELGIAEDLRAVADRFSSRGDDDGPSSQASLEDIIRTYALKTRGLEAVSDDPDALAQAVADATGYNRRDTEEFLLAECLASFDESFLDAIRDQFTDGNGARFVAIPLAAMREAPSVENVLERPFCFKSDGTVREIGRNFARKDQMARIPNFEERWEQTCALVSEYRDRLFALRAFEANVSLLRVTHAIHYAYTAEKRQRGALDYDDLVQETLRLLRCTDAAWIRYKLDAGIDHILIDEAQDNSGLQWEVFQALAEEIAFEDSSAAGVNRPRALFVVGDPKQSIYAFNGAEAKLFAESRESYAEILGARLRNESLFLSFRTAQPVLDFVDAVFSREAFEIASGAFPKHRAHHEDRFGAVELWPEIEPPEKRAPEYWKVEVDAVSDDSVDRTLARRIAQDIGRRIGVEKLASKGGRTLRANDVMILFQRRGVRFHEMLRALSEMGIESAGTDRVAVADDQAVHDLISLLRFAANTDDSLSLAVLLKSPFFGWSEDELFDLAAEREKTLLWSELIRRADAGSVIAMEARERLQAALDRGARRGPYALLEAMLEEGEVPGRRRMSQRLGSVYREAVEAFIDEALKYEDNDPRSIHGFLQRAENLTATIKRETQGEEASGVRVMTVHGAKGLEAPVVYLADADYCKSPGRALMRDPFAHYTSEALAHPVPILLPPSGADNRALKALRDDEVDQRHEEYERLLYVAATRAEERLIVCGGKPGKPTRWYGLCERGFDQLDPASVAVEAREGFEARCFGYGEVKRAEAAETEERSAPQALPAWLNRPVQPEEASPVIYPSALGEPDHQSGHVAAGPFSADPRRRGILVHRLLETLPQTAQTKWPEIVDRVIGPYRDEFGEEADHLVESIRGFLAEEQFAELFGAGSRAEVAVQGEIAGTMVSGEIDRLVVRDDEVLIAEFKSGRWVPETAGSIPDLYRRQVETYKNLVSGVFPGRHVRGFLIYLAAPAAFEIL